MLWFAKIKSHVPDADITSAELFVYVFNNLEIDMFLLFTLAVFNQICLKRRTSSSRNFESDGMR